MTRVKKLGQAVLAIAASLFVWHPRVAKADSPLTSTPFADAYQDVEVVKEASGQGLTDDVLAALSDPEVPDDVRAAIVNALGWSVEGQNHASEYLEYLSGRNESTLTIDELTPEEAFSFGYLLAMDDYFRLSAIGGSRPLEKLDAISVLRAAVLKNPNNFSVALIHSLAQAQLLMRDFERWCDVYQLVAAVNDNFVGERNMREEAVEIVMDYISLYQDYCDVGG
ncbi:MAG: hypothetical protein ACFB4I_18565 [Cyanophyceae cyanobacterium]